MHSTNVRNQVLIAARHAVKRKQQRAITEEMIRLTLEFGEVEPHYGRLRYYLTDRMLRFAGLAHAVERLRGLCVITSPDGVVITTYRLPRFCRPGVLRRRQSKWSGPDLD